MLMKLDSNWLMVAVIAVAMLAYMFSLGLDAILGDAGFGTFGTAGIITVAFFATVFLVNGQGIRFASMLQAVVAGLGGAFVVLLILTLFKALATR